MVDLRIKLPEHFLEGETRDGYYVSPEMKKVWAVELDLLNEFMRVCKKHNLRWFADGGTILGTVRHGGFIPMDDDIDVMMLREDYEKLNKIAATEFRHPYFWATELTDPGLNHGYAQLQNIQTTAILKHHLPKKFAFHQGIFLDVFPVDNISADEKVQDEFIKEVVACKQQCGIISGCTFMYRPNTTSTKNRLTHFLKHILYTICGKNREYDKAVQKMYNTMMRYDNEKTEYVAKLWTNDINKRRVWKREWFDGVIYMPFEFLEIPIPKGYVDLLDKFYGNWHVFVQGTSAHGGVGSIIFDTEKPYTEYIK